MPTRSSCSRESSIDPAQDLRQARARDDAVLHVVVGADPAHRGERSFSSTPHRRPVGRIGGEPDLDRARFPAELLDEGEVVVDLRPPPVELDDQHRTAAGRVVGPDRGFSSLDRDRVHHLDRGGEDPRCDRPGDRGAGCIRVLETREQRPHRLRRRQNAQRQLRRDPECSLGADEQAEQIRAFVPDRQLDQLPIGQNDLGREHVVDGEAVLQAVRPSRVLGDVAADRAHLLRRRVGRVVEAVGRNGARHVEIRHAGLDDDLAPVDIDREEAIHPRQ